MLQHEGYQQTKGKCLELEKKTESEVVIKNDEDCFARRNTLAVLTTARAESDALVRSGVPHAGGT